MRQPLRRQLLLPLLAILAVTLALVTAAHVWLTTRSLQQALDERMRTATRTLDEGSFPLEENVLRQARGLCGAELAVSDAAGRVLAASSDSVLPLTSSAPEHTVPDWRTLRIDGHVTIAGENYFHAVVQLARRSAVREPQWLHIFYPERPHRAAQWRAVYPSLLVGLGLFVVAIALTSAWAVRLTRPIDRLQAQVQRIAQGDFQPLAPPRRNDELRDLALSVNRMAELLQQYADELRRHERQQTLHKIGSGIAHQLRNAATGARMALDLFQREQPHAKQNENLLVLSRQLELMEHYLQRFLLLGRSLQAPPQQVAVRALVEGALGLVRPLAEHLHVAIAADDVAADLMVRGDRTSLEQLLLNLITNAIDACARPTVVAPEVRLEVKNLAPGVQIAISDNGPGFAPEIADRIAEPFVTNKPEGTGLGLAVAKEIVAQHGGKISWSRTDGWTQFVVTLLNGPDTAK